MSSPHQNPSVTRENSNFDALDAHLSELEAGFQQLVEALLSDRRSEEHLTLELSSEQSQFVRFNHAKVRQAGHITDGWVTLRLMKDERHSLREFPFAGEWAIDAPHATAALADLRQELPQLSPDPYLVLPSGTNTSREVYGGDLLDPELVIPTVLSQVDTLDFNGLYAAGSQIRAYADDCGQHHWFATRSFSLDYSLFTPTGQAVKSTLASDRWHTATYNHHIHQAKTQLQQLDHPPKQLARGHYRTFFAPTAAAELVGMLCWDEVGEAALQQGESALMLLHRHEKRLSPAFTLRENFQRGLVPRFNHLGEIAAPEIPVIAAGQLINTLVNNRSAREYHQVANGADSSETMRAPEISPGTLPPDRILAALGTGLYVSNLHYLGWSDRPTGRITGMTRYACFWVEDGAIVAPIENLRFDESLYHFLGENLIALTNEQEFIPDISTYSSRKTGGIWVPGLLVEDFTYTL